MKFIMSIYAMHAQAVVVVLVAGGRSARWVEAATEAHCNNTT